jgi:DNA modification methylase
MDASLAVNRVYTGDALELMDRLEPSSIDLVLTDPHTSSTNWTTGGTPPKSIRPRRARW